EPLFTKNFRLFILNFLPSLLWALFSDSLLASPGTALCLRAPFSNSPPLCCKETLILAKRSDHWLYHRR
ncbi:hypothetical protein, partial [Endozoicomonas sp. ONNA2]|uniref:hypothetical protein n=1 Tax=Endozoicomonas sp. ONNA2 TaxID=2828741 RepID=UPI00214991D4